MVTTNAQRRRTYRLRHKVKVAAAHKDWATRNLKERNAYAQAKRYGLTVAQVDAMREKQEGRCAICNVAHEKMTVDHSHTTGKGSRITLLDLQFGNWLAWR